MGSLVVQQPQWQLGCKEGRKRKWRVDKHMESISNLNCIYQKRWQSENVGVEATLGCWGEHILTRMQDSFFSHLCVKMGLSKQRMSLCGGRAGEGKQWSDETGQSQQACRHITHCNSALICNPPLPERPVVPADVLGSQCFECLRHLHYKCVGAAVKSGDDHHHTHNTRTKPVFVHLLAHLLQIMVVYCVCLSHFTKWFPSTSIARRD